MILIIEPKSGTDLIKFNEKRMLVRQKIESSFFIQESEPEYDFYVDEGLILGYNKDDFLEYIEIIHPSKAIYQKVDLLSLDKKSFEKIMNENTKDINIKSNEVDYCYSDWACCK